MGKRVAAFAVFLMFGTPAFSQQGRLTMEDVVLRASTTLAPRNLTHLQWIRNSDFWSYTDTSGTRVWKESIGTPPVTLFTLASLNKALHALSADTLDRVPAFTWESDSSIQLEVKRVIYRFVPFNGKAEAILEKSMDQAAANLDQHESTLNIAYTLGNNLWIQTRNKQFQITVDQNPGIVNGQLVHRQEFGIHKGTFWSPRGNRLAFYRKDETMVTDYPIPDYAARPAVPHTVKYPMAGDSSHQVKVGVYDLTENRTVFLKTGSPDDQYLTNIAWSPDGGSIYVAVLNRGQDHLKLNRYNVSTGEFEKTLFEEKDSKYVQPLHPMLFVPGKPEWFVWQSRRDGYNHLYLYNTDGKLIRQLTKGPFEVTGLNGIDPSGKRVFYMSTAMGALNRDLYAVPVKRGLPARLTQGTGVHKTTLNDRFTLFLDEYAAADTPRRIAANAAGGTGNKVLLEAENPLRDFDLGTINVFNLPNHQGDSLSCRMILPPRFDINRKYPVIVYLYNGPNIQLIHNGWQSGANLWFQYMAQHGFIMFTIDGRGSANRGLAFEQAVFRRLGTVELEDQLAAVRFLKSLPYIDSTRMGIHGWSYGGFMTIGMITRHPGHFKAAVAGGSVIDWRYYEVMYTERYMDTPQQNLQGYEESNLMNYVQNLDCKLLMIHGTSDDVVVYQHSMMYLKKAVELGKQIDYFAYPGYGHNVRGKDRMHLLNMISDYFISNL